MTPNNLPLPHGFTFLTDIDPTIIESVRYFANENFLARPAAGYTINKIICTIEAAQRLSNVHEHLKNHGYELVVYDGYRPQRAVNDFINWSSTPETEPSGKSFYYPTIAKADAMELGYLAKRRSTHSRGSTFDLTIIAQDAILQPIKYLTRELNNGEVIPFLDDNTVDMGASFDLFHAVSHHDCPFISSEQLANRNILRTAMEQFGFQPYYAEWWHYTLANEPYPDTYFDFVCPVGT